MNNLKNINTKHQIIELSKDIKQLLYQTKNLVQSQDQRHFELRCDNSETKIDLINDALIYFKVYVKNQNPPLKLFIDYYNN